MFCQHTQTRCNQPATVRLVVKVGKGVSFILDKRCLCQEHADEYKQNSPNEIVREEPIS